MGCTRREFLALASAGAAAGLAGCTPTRQQPQTPTEDPESPDPSVDLTEFESLALDPAAWRYDEDNDVYYQLGLTYCLKPATKTYESLAIFVPGAYFTAEENGSTYTCTVNDKAVVGAFTAATAPVLMPINTGTLAAQASPTTYAFDGLAPYLEAGCVYVYAGFRAGGPRAMTPPRARTSSSRAGPRGRSWTSRPPSDTCATTAPPCRATRAASLSLASAREAA